MFEHMRKPVKKPADFIVVGPLTEESQIVTGNIRGFLFGSALIFAGKALGL